MVNNNANAEHLRTDEFKNDNESEVNKTPALDENLLLTSRQSCNAVSKYNDTLTGLTNKPPYNNATVICPSIKEHSTNVECTENQSYVGNQELSTELNLAEHYAEAIKAIDVTQIITNESEYAWIDAADLDKHIIWSLHDEGNRIDADTVILENASLQDQLVTNDSPEKTASRMVNSDARSSRRLSLDDLKENASNKVNSDGLDLEENLLVNNDSQSIESVNDLCDIGSLNDSASCDSSEATEESISEVYTEPIQQNLITESGQQKLIVDDDTDLYQLFDEKVAEMNRTWHRPLYVKDACFIFSNVSTHKQKKIIESHQNEMKASNTSIINILQAVTTSKKIGPYIYFDTHKYPVTEKPFYDAEKKLVNPVWDRLKNHIQACAIECGFVLHTNGGSRTTIELPHREFRCNRSKKYKNQSKLIPSFAKYRKTSMINDRSKGRGAIGLRMRRRRGHVRPIHNTCVFNFTVCADKTGYHMRNGRGCITHKYHRPSFSTNNILSSKYLPENIKQTVDHMTDGLVNNGAIRNVIFKKTGKILALANIRYLCKKVQENAVQDEDILESLSSVDQMINYFIDRGYDYYCLLHTNNMNVEDVVNNVTTKTNVSNAIPNFVSHCKPSEVKAITKYCIDHQHVMELTSAQHLMIAICWVLPQEKRLFDLYPEVLFIDITSDSNKEKRPLFTVTGRTTAGTMYTLMRAFLPNEKTWIFRWLFSIVLPNSFKKETLKRVRVMITDGDSQEYQQLDVAIREHISQAYRVRCGYHLNKKNWEKHGPKFMNYKDEEKQSKCSIQSHIIADWIYSWMKPSCETELQYLASKYLLLHYLNQEWMLEDCGEKFVDGVKKMIRDNIEPHEDHYVYFKRKHIRHYGEYSNSAHEGTNHGLKASSDGVKPSHLLDKASERLSSQGERSYKYFVTKTRQQLNEYKSWNELLCCEHLVNRGASLLVQEKQAAVNYDVIRTSKTRFYIRYKRENRSISDSPIPQWENIRVIDLFPKHMECSCCMYERDGLLCRHMFVLFAMIDHEVSHHDIDIVWWLSYAVYAYSIDDDNHCDPSSEDLSTILELLNMKRNNGPKIKIDMFDKIATHSVIPTDWLIESENEVFCLNKDIKITREDIKSSSMAPFGLESMSMSQSSTNLSQSDDTEKYRLNSLSEYKAMKESQKSKDPFYFMRDTFICACNTLKSMPSEYTIDFESDLSALHMRYKQIAFKLNGGRSQGNIVSSCIADSRKRKSHGSDNFKKRK